MSAMQSQGQPFLDTALALHSEIWVTESWSAVLSYLRMSTSGTRPGLCCIIFKMETKGSIQES